jgi:hypothetical protein
MQKPNKQNPSSLTQKETQNESASLSRRKWLERVSIPALATVGVSMIGIKAFAAPSNYKETIDEKIKGAGIYNIRDYGAKGDGKTLDTAAIQAAIDACHKDEGGMVLVPAGDFVTGTIELKSNITLHIATKGRLLGSPKHEDYHAGKGVPSGNGNVVFLYAANAENISIEGRGTIDGNGGAFYNGQGDNTGPGSKTPGYTDRPHLVIFYKCTNLLIRDTFFTKSAYHCFRILECKKVNIDGIRIYNRVNKNNDGFHFNSCEYVHISNCDVQCQDDACALFGSNQFVTVSNCSFSTRWSIFRFGGGQSQNIAISNCLIYDTYGCPIKISAGRSQIENLSFSNIIMKNVTGPIGIGFSGTNRNTNSPATDSPKSFLRNISFNNIKASVVSQPVNHPDIPFDVKVYDGEQNSCITLNAWGDNYIENISFNDVHITYAGGGTPELAAKQNVPQVSAEYFGVWANAPFGPPAYGMYARNVKGLTLQNVRFDFEKPDVRPAVVFDNVQDATLSALSAQGPSQGQPLIRLINAKDVLITAARVITPVATFLSAEGAATEGITIDGGDLRKAKKLSILGDGAKQTAVRIRL